MKNTRSITLGAAVCALNLLALFGAAALPSGRLACWFLSSLFVFALAAEGDFLGAVLACLATCALAFFLLANKLALLPFVVLLGHFGIFKTWLDGRIGKKTLRLAFCLLYCDLCSAIGLFLFKSIFIEAVALPWSLPWYVWVVSAQVVFLLYTLLYSLCQRWYVNGPLYKALHHKK